MGIALSACLSNHYLHQYQEINQKTIKDAIYSHDYKYLGTYGQDETYDWIKFILTHDVGNKINLIRIFSYQITEQHLIMSNDEQIKKELRLNFRD